MWLFCKSGFFSAVRHATVPQTIHLRARFAGDLERLCARHGIDPAGIEETPDGDYRFRMNHELQGGGARWDGAGLGLF